MLRRPSVPLGTRPGEGCSRTATGDRDRAGGAGVRHPTSGKSFTPEQQRWLDHIREHLVENLSIDRNDFDAILVLADAGGWGRRTRRSAADWRN
jgi:hypothetical protein